MKENRWGAFLCNCSSSLDEDFKKIGKIAPFDELASETHMKIEEFAKKGLEADPFDILHQYKYASFC